MKFKEILAWIIIIASFILAAYVGIWAWFIKPIIVACKAYDAGTLTGLLIGTTVLKCIFSGTASSLIVYIGAAIGKEIMK